MKAKLAAALFLLSMTACNGSDLNDSLGIELGRDEVNGTPQSIPTNQPPPGGCHGDQSSLICLALKYVVYENSRGDEIIPLQEALENLVQINRLWAQCSIEFEIEEYLSVDADQYDLNFNTPTLSELSVIRNTFDDDKHLLIVTTGSWSGSLGAGAANAWAAMPGSGLYGVVLEEPVGNYPNIIAHELGHYLNLGHVSDSSNLMNPVIYQGSSRLTSSQCSAARSAINYYWQDSLR